MNDNPTAALSLAVPAYFHPAVTRKVWQRLPRLAHVLRFVVLNVNSGPGDAVDPHYVPVVAKLQAAGVRVVGYVDTDYGRRTPGEVARDVDTYHHRYGVEGVFLDQVTTGLDQLDHYAQCVLAARTHGSRFVVLNPGAHPHPGYVDLANVTVTFEGPWAQYVPLSPPEWVHRYPSSRFCHLVHSLPRCSFAQGLRLAAGRHVGSAFLTDSRGANPWDHVPALLTGELELARSGAQAR
ncbi:MAG: spherulation-specific family 4 protein [Kineosporiaceae bacterium]